MDKNRNQKKAWGCTINFFTCDFSKSIKIIFVEIFLITRFFTCDFLAKLLGNGPPSTQWLDSYYLIQMSIVKILVGYYMFIRYYK
jgi:hypothetical protein